MTRHKNAFHWLGTSVNRYTEEVKLNASPCESIRLYSHSLASYSWHGSLPEEVGHPIFAIGCTIRPRNPGQPVESAKTIHCIWCAIIKCAFHRNRDQPPLVHFLLAVDMAHRLCYSVTGYSTSTSGLDLRSSRGNYICRHVAMAPALC